MARSVRGLLPHSHREKNDDAGTMIWFSAMGLLFRTELLRQLRGMGFFVLLGACLFYAWWFGRRNWFGSEASVWLSGGEITAIFLPVFMLICAALQGVRSEGAQERHNATALLGRRPYSQLAGLPARMAALAVLLMAAAALLVFWAPLGAARGGLPVVWAPSFYTFFVVLFPAVLSGLFIGSAARQLVSHDLAGLLLALALCLPLVSLLISGRRGGLFYEVALDRGGVLIAFPMIIEILFTALAPAGLALGILLLVGPVGLAAQRRWLFAISMLLLSLLSATTFVRDLGMLSGQMSGLLRQSTGIFNAMEGDARVLRQTIDLPQKPEKPLRGTIDFTLLRPGMVAIKLGPSFQLNGELIGPDYTRELLDGDLRLMLTAVGDYRLNYEVRPIDSAALRWRILMGGELHMPGRVGAFWPQVDSRWPQPPMKIHQHGESDRQWIGIGHAGGAVALQHLPKLAGMASDPIALIVASLQINLFGEGLEHRGWAAIFDLYQTRITRISRLSGGGSVELAVSPFALGGGVSPLSDALLRRLQLLAPFYRDVDSPAGEIVDQLLVPFHEELVRQLFWQPGDSPQDWLLAEGLVRYLHEVALNQGKETAAIRQDRRAGAIVPLSLVANLPSFLRVPRGQAREWQGPVGFARDSQGERVMAFWHALRLALGDEEFERLMRHIRLPRENSLADLLRAHPLDPEAAPIVALFLDEGGIADLAIERAEAFLIQDPQTQALRYETRFTLINKGSAESTAQMILFSEGENQRRTVSLRAGETTSEIVIGTARPTALVVDPLKQALLVEPEQREGGISTHEWRFRSVTTIR